MPRPRPRPQREPCDCLDCSDRVPSSVGPQSAGGPARQDPPPKSLLIYLANAACTAAGGAAALAEARTPHLDAAVRAGYSGLLAFQPGPPELEQLLAPPAGQADGATLAERYGGRGRKARGRTHVNSHSTWLPLLCRFMDLRVAMLAGGPEAAGVGLAAGCHSVRRLDGEGGAPPEPARVAELIQACRGEDIDMILLALDAQTLAAQPGCGSSDQDAACGALEWADALVRELNQAPGFRGTVLLTLVLGPGPGPAATVPLAEEDPPLIQPLSGTLSADGQLVSRHPSWAPPSLLRCSAGHRLPS